MCCDLARHCVRSRERSSSAGEQGLVAGLLAACGRGVINGKTGFKMIKCQEGTEAVIRSCWGYREGAGWGGLRDMRD